MNRVHKKFQDGVLVEHTINGVSQPISNTLELPRPMTILGNAASAMIQAIKTPKPVSTEERERRLAICHACEFLKDGKRCAKCGCHVNWKSRLEAWHCPIGKW